MATNTYLDNDFYIIEFKINESLRPKELRFLNKVVLLHSLNSDLEIRYSILSDASDGSNKGKRWNTYRSARKTYR
jgi:hypothetical protein